VNDEYKDPFWERAQEDMEEMLGGAFAPWFYGPRPVRTGRFPLNIARLMREGVPPVPMLLDEWLVLADLHWLYSDAEAGKTWVGIWLGDQVMRGGGTVAWFDEELGEEELTRRLLAFGANPDVVEQHFAYFAYPGFTASEQDVLDHREILKVIPGLVLAVYDTATDMLAEAGLDENSGVDVTAWVKRFPEEARKLGASQLVLDHVGKNTSNKRHAVGSRGKRAKAKVQYSLTCKKPYDRDTLGKIKIERTKNTRGARIPEVRTVEVGGDGSGKFIWRDISPITLIDEAWDNGENRQRLIESIIGVLRAAGADGFSKNEICHRVSGSRNEILKLVEELASDDFYPVEVFKRDGKGYDRFRLASSPEDQTA
jgi:AAA domain